MVGVTEKFFFWYQKVPQYITWAIATLALTLSARLLVGSWWIALAYTPLFLFLGAISNSARFAGYCVASRGTIAVVSSLVAVVLAIVAYSGPGVTQLTRSEASIVLLFLIVGSLVGSLIRLCFSRIISYAILGRERLGQSILTTAVWTAGIVLFPWQGHAMARTGFLLGIAFGIVVSRSFRFRMARAAAAFRRIEQIVDVFPWNIERVQASEYEALKLLAKGRQLPRFRFRALRGKIEDWRGTERFTKRVALVSASVYRIEGQYADAVSEAASAADPPRSLTDAHLVLLKVLSLYELARDKEADALLGDLMHSRAGHNCPLATATTALRAAEEVLSSPKGVRSSSEPLIRVTRAFEIRRRFLLKRMRARGERSALSNFLRGFAEIGVPVSAPFMLDILGQCLLAAGYTEEAKIAIARCIELDRFFAASYLHLGDYFLFRRHLATPRKSERHDLWHAAACYHSVRAMERNRSSRIRRSAKNRLDSVQKLRSQWGEGE